MKNWDAPFSADDANDAACESATGLVKGSTDNSIPRPFALSRHFLDYSLQSLEHVESYLLDLHKDFSRWARTGVLPIKAFGFKSKREVQDQLTNAIFQCGAYVGEVIRRTWRPDLQWIRHQEWARTASEADLHLLGPSANLGTTLMLQNSRKDLWLPFEKVLKFLEFGMQDSVVSFAAVVVAQRRADILEFDA